MKLIGNRLFGKYYLFMAVVVLVFVAIGVFASRLVVRFSPSPVDDHHAVFYARLVDILGDGDRLKGLRRLKELNAVGTSARVALVDSSGSVLAPVGDKLSFDWASMPKPTQPYQFVTLRGPFRSLVLLPGTPAHYLSVASERTLFAPSMFFSTTFAALALSVLMGFTLAMILLFQSLRGKAGEIERLVDQLKSVDQSRMRLLQELAHDLRTPVASLRNLLETVSGSSDKLEPKVRTELLSLSLTEVDYFERLVEDLLTLAQVSEPRYHSGHDLVSLGALLDDEAENAAITRGREGPAPALLKNLPAEELHVRGDSHLLRRMLRNTLDNAFSFARNEVRISLQLKDGQVLISIEDDGPGLTPEALAAFGERRSSRVVNASASSTRGERLSVGLGSVIVKTVAQIHGGRLEATNGGLRGGALIIMTLPLAEWPPAKLPLASS